MFAYYCASLESSLKAGGSQTKLLPQPGPAAVGFGCSLQLAGQPLRMDQTDSAWWEGDQSSWPGELVVPEQSMTVV